MERGEGTAVNKMIDLGYAKKTENIKNSNLRGMHTFKASKKLNTERKTRKKIMCQNCKEKSIFQKNCSDKLFGKDVDKIEKKQFFKKLTKTNVDEKFTKVNFNDNEHPQLKYKMVCKKNDNTSFKKNKLKKKKFLFFSPSENKTQCKVDTKINNTRLSKVCSNNNIKPIDKPDFNDNQKETKTIIQKSLMTYVVRAVPFVEENLMNSMNVHHCVNENENNDNVKTKVKRYSRAKGNMEDKTEFYNNSNNVDKTKKTKKVKCSEKYSSLQQKESDSIKENKESNNDKDDKMVLTYEIYENSVSEITKKPTFNNFTNKQPKIIKNNVKQNIKSFSEPCIQVSYKQRKNKSRRSKMKPKLSYNTMVLMEKRKNMRSSLKTLKVSNSLDLSYNRNGIFAKNIPKKNSLGNKIDINEVIESYNYHNDKKIDKLRNDRKNKNSLISTFKNSSVNIKDKISLIKHINLVKHSKKINENQCCFVDPDLYSSNSEVILNKAKTMQDTDKTKKKNTEDKTCNETTTNEFIAYSSQLNPTTMSLIKIKKESTEELSETKSETDNTNVYIKTIQNEYFKLMNKINPQFTTDKTVISRFLNNNCRALPTDTRQVLNNLLPIKTKEMAVSATYSQGTLNKNKYMSDKGIMCTGVGLINCKKDKKTKHKQSITKESKQLDIFKNNEGNKVDFEMITKLLKDDIVGCNNMESINKMKHKSMHFKNRENRLRYSERINSVKLSSQSAHLLTYQTLQGGHIGKKELEDVKIKFKDNFNFTYDTGHVDLKHQRGIWNNIRNGGNRLLTFFWPTGPIRSCFKGSFFR